jgi:hypothetical protein
MARVITWFIAKIAMNDAKIGGYRAKSKPVKEYFRSLMRCVDEGGYSFNSY